MAFESAMIQDWQEIDDGREITSSPEIIAGSLEMIHRDRIFCLVRARGYESGQVTLVDYTAAALRLDRPPDWPAATETGPLRVLFRDKAKLWNQFFVELTESSSETLTTTFPTKQLRIQRRSNYRVEPPPGSKAAFWHRGELEIDFQVACLSANGVRLCADRRSSALAKGEPVKGLCLNLSDSDGERTQFEIKEGRIMRTGKDERRRHFLGIKFILTTKEENRILNYIRRRERELLRRLRSEE